MKVALVHEFLNQYGGGERVLEAFVEMFPDAPIYTLVYNQQKMQDHFSNVKIKTSFIQRTMFGKSKTRWYLPWMPTAIESFDLSGYDLVLSDSSAFSKGVLTRSDTLHICYCHTPTRYLWEDTFEYIQNQKIPWPVNKLTPYLLNYLRIWDYNAAQRPDYFIANSNFVKKRINKYYHRGSEVIYPFVYTDKFKPSKNKKDYYLVAGRMVAYKRYDLAIKAFNEMPERKLLIVGDGVKLNEYKQLAKSKNIKFLGRVSDKRLAQAYAEAKAYIFPAEEDFGITPLEAMSAATPVIAFGKGGATETVIAGETGVFFDRQNTQSLIKAVDKFERIKFERNTIIKRAKEFSKEVFKKKMEQFINNKIKNY